MELNENQKEAVETIEGSILIVAGPGSGKTRVITQKILYLIRKKKVKPENILALTFSEKATEEMKNRVEEEMGTATELQISTFHSFCKDFLEDNVLEAGINANAKVISREHALVWALENIDSFGITYLKVPFRPSDLVNRIMEGISAFRDELIEPEGLQVFLDKKLKEELTEEDKDYYSKLNDLNKVFKAYQEYKQKNNLIDFDDMISKTYYLLKEKNLLLKKYQQKFQYILVDEFQDTNYAQLALVELLARKNKNLGVVADDDQCIYRFRGAYLTNIHQLETYFPETKRIDLKQNYRSTKQIVAASQQLIESHPDRLQKELFSEIDGSKIEATQTDTDASEAEFVANTIQERTKEGAEYNDFFILTRKRKDGLKYAEALKRRNLPVEFIGTTDFFKQPIIQEMLAYLKVLADPFESGIQWAKVLGREHVPEIDIQKIFSKASKLKERNDTNDKIYEVLLNHLDELELREKELVKSILERIEKLMKFKANHSCSELALELMLNQTDLYKKQVFCLDLEAKHNVRLLNKLFELIRDFESLNGNDLKKLLKHLDYASGFEIETEEPPEEENTIKVMTIHQSKGKEAKTVFVCDVAERHLPLRYQEKPFFVPAELNKGVKSKQSESDLYKQEERRLMYVAMTRAKEKIHIVFPKKYAENKTPVRPSEFLHELNYKNNPLIEAKESSLSSDASFAKNEENLEKAIGSAQKQASQFITQLDIKPAMQKILELAKLKHIKENKNLTEFDEKEFSGFSFPENEKIEQLVKCEPFSLINKDEIYFYATNLKTYQECPNKFKLSFVLNIPTPPKTYFDLGTAVHSTIDHLTKVKKEGKEINEKMALELLEKFWDSKSFDSDLKENQEKEKAKKMLSNFLEKEKQFKGEIIESEKRFNIEIDGFRVTGKIDRINKNQQGKIEVLDYKTGTTTLSQNKLKEDLQMILYCLAVKDLYGELPQKIGHYYPNPEIEERKRIVEAMVDGAMIENGLNTIKETIQKVIKEEFKAVENPPCYNCDYKAVCEYYVGK